MRERLRVVVALEREQDRLAQGRHHLGVLLQWLWRGEGRRLRCKLWHARDRRLTRGCAGAALAHRPGERAQVSLEHLLELGCPPVHSRARRVVRLGVAEHEAHVLDERGRVRVHVCVNALLYSAKVHRMQYDREVIRHSVLLWIDGHVEDRHGLLCAHQVAQQLGVLPIGERWHRQLGLLFRGTELCRRCDRLKRGRRCGADRCDRRGRRRHQRSRSLCCLCAQPLVEVLLQLSRHQVHIRTWRVVCARIVEHQTHVGAELDTTRIRPTSDLRQNRPKVHWV
mmetsp:Transcript_372/g.945  ORF Transcript_372/g.945 Transcript_372/m.945 type:complete len:282 (+) Transcript_372:738-1583(+)